MKFHLFQAVTTNGTGIHSIELLVFIYFLILHNRSDRLSQPALFQPRFPVRFGKTLIEAGASPAHPCTQWAEATGL